MMDYRKAAKDFSKSSHVIMELIDNFATDGGYVMSPKSGEMTYEESRKREDFSIDEVSAFKSFSDIISGSDGLILATGIHDHSVIELPMWENDDHVIFGTTWHNIALTWLDNVLHDTGEGLTLSERTCQLISTGMYKEVVAVEFHFLSDVETGILSKSQLMTELGMSPGTLNKYLDSVGIRRPKSGGGGRGWKIFPEDTIKLCDHIVSESADTEHRNNAIELRNKARCTL